MSLASIFTIGHSTHPIDYFVGLLSWYGIDVLIDVRSIAASRFNPQFNKKSLQDSLAHHNIAYHHLGEAFGARKTNPEILNANGKVDFVKIRQTSEFNEGMKFIDRLIHDNARIVLMCSEADPFECHRFSMISPALKQAGYQISHILKDRSLLSQKNLEQKLIERFKSLSSPLSLFGENEVLELAYRIMNEEIGFNPSSKKKP